MLRSRAPRRLSTATVLCLVAALCATVGVCVATATVARSQPVTVAPDYAARPPGTRPNIVFVLTDDLSSNLIAYMPHVQGLMAQGMSFSNYTVADSLCCPSRASIFTGEFPHDTGVTSNVAPYGGYTGFQTNGDQARTFATSLSAAGYRTGFVGKYLNGYLVAGDASVPPGWDMWGGIGGGGYNGFDYDMSINGVIKHYGTAPADYATTVTGQLGNSFIRQSARAGKPFALELATYSPHSPDVPAPSDAGGFPIQAVPRGPAFDTVPTNAPPWLADRPALTAQQIAVGDRTFRRRIACVQSVDRMIGSLERTLYATGQWANTVFVFSSDNGLHIGEHGLTGGKMTAFDTDVVVPLIVTGPQIAAGVSNDAVVQNVDLAPTFDQLAGARVPATVDGRSLVPLLHGRSVPWRSLALIEQQDPATSPGDPDAQSASAGRPPSYLAIRSATFTYVQYQDGEREYYDRTTDPYELDNTYGDLPDSRIVSLDDAVTALSGCHAAECWLDGEPH